MQRFEIDPLDMDETQIYCRAALEWILKQVDAEFYHTWADKLLNHFGSLANTLGADLYIVAELLDNNYEAARHLHQWNRVMLHAWKCEIRYVSLFSVWPQLIEYLQNEMGHLRIEQMRALFLDSSHALIADEVLAMGESNQVQCYPKQIIRRALILQASEIIVAHNHPSGSAQMSREDKSTTYILAEACRAVGISLRDSLVICRDSYTSFRQDNPAWAANA